MDQVNKDCRKCHNTKLLSDFYYRKDNKKYRTICKECWYLQSRDYILNHADKQKQYYKKYNQSDKNKENQSRYYENNHEYALWAGARARAKKLKLPFNIDVCDVIIPELCPILNVPIQYNRGRVQDNSATLDRIVPNLGYIKGNIQVLSHKANAMKYKATSEELLQFAKWVYETYGKKDAY